MKSYIQSNRQDRRGIADYTSIIEEATSKGQFPLARSGVRYFRQAAKGAGLGGGGGGGNHWALGSSYSISSSSSSYSSSSMTDRRASLGAMLALGAAAQKAILESRFIAPVERVRWLERVAEQLELAEQLTETYHDATMAASSPSTSVSNSFSSFSSSSSNSFASSSVSTGGLPPASFAVDAYAADRSSAIVAVQGEALTEAYLAETYLVLYRATRQPRYREYAWDLVKAIAVNGTADRDYRLPNSLYASATLKYLWLIFAEEEGTGEGVEKEAPVEGSSSSSTGGGGAGDNLYLPLNKWVFNEAGQPLPICGANEKVWPAERCSYRLMSYQELLVAQFDL